MDFISLVITVIVAIAIVGVGVWFVYTGRVQVASVQDAIDVFYQAKNLVETYAPAADQLLAIGALAKEDRLEYVIDMVMSYMDGIDPEQIRGVVEAWVKEQKDGKKSYGMPL